MIDWTKNFYDSNKYAILWTVVYIAVTWAVMRYMFNFDIFSAYRWHQLMHSHLHGFAGFVFGILILAMVPLYVATTVLISRKKEPLFNFKLTMPQVIKDAFVQPAFIQPTPQKPESVPDPQPEPAPAIQPTVEDTPVPQPESLPNTVPAELKVAYARARDHVARTQTSAFDLAHATKTAPTPQPTPELVPVPDIEPDMPIPTDFDIDETTKIVNDVPVFTDLDFDDEDIIEEDETEPAPQINDVQTTTNDNDIVTKYLNQKSIPYKTEDEVIITDAFAIVSHTDSDFWVADNESWFAAGKIRKSPIVSVMEAATTHKLKPILYLGADNIMDIDELRKQWEKSGIRVITDLKDLI